MNNFCDNFMRYVGERVGRLLYSAESGARNLDAQHAFIVEYQMSGDLKLSESSAVVLPSKCHIGVTSPIYGKT